MRNKGNNVSEQKVKTILTKKTKIILSISLVLFIILGCIFSMQTSLINLSKSDTKLTDSTVSELDVPIINEAQDEEEQLYVETNMFKFDGTTFNAETKKVENGVEGIYFTVAGLSAYEYYNFWIPSSAKEPYQGLVADELTEDGNIQFNYPQAGIFTLDEVNGKDIYTNVKIPVVTDEEGYYVIDSDTYDYYFPNGTPTSDTSLLYKTDKNSYIGSSSGYIQGFFPFNYNNGESAKYGFGVNVKIPFYMTSNGKMPNTDEDMIYEFSGDDDVWVYIDGKLLLDLGGLHDAISGEINFATGEITYYNGLKDEGAQIDSSKTRNLFDILGDNWNDDESQEHQLQMFYLERGMGESNCKLRYNLLQKYDVVVHHYIEGTEESVPSNIEGGYIEDQIIEGLEADPYVTEQSYDIDPAYELSYILGTPSGNIPRGGSEVIYYYKLKDPIIDSSVNKTTEQTLITSNDEAIPYTIEYNAEIEDYRGNVIVTIVDTLPYKLATTEDGSLVEGINLDGGIYDAERQTITWTERTEGIDTYDEVETPEGSKSISITKNIELIFTNIDYEQPSISNSVEANLEFEGRDIEDTKETEVTTNVDFTKDIEVTKIWDHTNNIYGIPEEIDIVIMKETGTGEETVAEKRLNSSNKVGEDENTWTWTFEGLDKYDEQGEEINYIVEEIGHYLHYYKQEIEYVKNTETDTVLERVIIRNTYNGPVVEVNKEAETENGLDYVVEKEKITYKIVAENTGELGTEILVKDTIPAGTTFVEGSIKINGEAKTELGEADLGSGIRLEVPARENEATPGKTELSFEVTVNKLEGDALEGTIENTATVDKTPDDPDDQEESEEPTNETTTEIKKADLKFNKTASAEDGETVKEGDEITYTINLDNTNGKAPADVLVKDTIPEGTAFVEGSIKINEEAKAELGEANLESGIRLEVPAGESYKIEFKVKVEDIENGTSISNTAIIKENPDDPESEEEETNTEEKTYVEPIVEVNKEAETENGLDYVVEKEKITYKIVAENTGELGTEILVKDTIPAGTTFVEGSIKINDQVQEGIGASELAEGIRLEVPARENEATPGKTELSFEVTVDELEGDALEGTIENTATVDKTPDDPDDQEESEEPTNETTTEIKKADLKFNKTASAEDGETVKEGDEITYTINLDNTNGKAPADVLVKDTIPEGTAFVEGSIKINEEAKAELGEANLESGIRLEVPAGESYKIEFKVKVEDIENGTSISNTAIIKENPDDPESEEEETNTEEKTYVEPIVEVNKEAETENGLAYVVEKEKITYKIVAENTGDLGTEILVKDTIPAGTTFVEGSIKINGEAKTELGEADLGSGIRLEVPARENEATPGKTELSFEVTVNKLEGDALEGTIENTATVDKTPDDPDDQEESEEPTNETTTEIKKADLKFNKTASAEDGETVKEGDEITYTINLDNTNGKAPADVLVKDTIPEGTAFVEGSIKINEEAKAELGEANLESGIRLEVPAGESYKIEFKVKVEDIENGTSISNTAIIKENPDDPESEEEETNTEEKTYVEPIVEVNKEAETENGLAYVVEKEKITYKIVAENTGDLGTEILVKDTIPEGTTFVEGSIKINNEAQEGLTETNLAEGIRLEVPARENEDTAGKVELSFDVTVDELEGDTLEGTIVNTATINKNPDDPESPDEPTNETETEIKKADLEANKVASAEDGDTVKEGDEITYTINLDNTNGTAPADVLVKDNIPEGTTFVEGSITINDEAQEELTETNLAEGIRLEVPAGESTKVEFKVTVGDLENGTKVANTAVIKENPDDPESEEEPTNTEEKTYVESIIEANKEVITENGLDYVVEGEEITYKIVVENTGDLNTEVLVKDSIPEGTTFVEGSIKINNEVQEGLTETNIAEGIRLEVPARENEDTAGKVELSFKVIVNKPEEDKINSIKNIATINKNPDNPESEDEPTNETGLPVLIYDKKAEIIRKSEEDIEEGAVTAGDRIKYTIRIKNVGEESIQHVEIKDTVPEGTTIYQIYDDGEISLNSTNEIVWEVNEISTGEEVEVSFEVTVDYDKEAKTISNIGTVDGKETNEEETPYEVPEIGLESSIEKQGPDKITTVDERVSYTINFKTDVRDFEGKGTLTIVDYLPYEIDEANSEIAGGEYNRETKTITWQEDLDEINTYLNEDGTVTIDRSKTLVLKYVYPDEENLSGTIDNRVEGTIKLTQEQEVEDPSNPDETITEEVVVKEDTKEDNHEVNVEIPAKVIVHHYIYDEARGGETTESVPSKDGGTVADETIDGIVGNRYETNPSNQINANYECVNTEPERHEGTMTKTDIEVTYYYKLKTAELGSEMEKTAEASRDNVLTQEDGVVTYRIVYRAGIKEYQGRATITIVDRLPADIDINDARVDLDGGTYNAIDKTITWTEEVEVDTFTAGEMYDETFEKEIQVVYKDQNVVETLVNEAEGTITIYYPENHTTDPGEERDTNTITDTAEVEQEYRVTKEVEKVWDDNNNAKGNRPASVTVQLTANGNTVYNGQELEKVVLSNGNNWSYTFTNLPKYDGFGNEITYSVIETETNVGDLEYYDAPVITTGTDKIIVTNKYKLMDTYLENNIDKTGTDKVTSSKEEVTYNINYNATITDYIGEAVVKVVDTLPYKIDVENSELAGGTYDEATNTITWEERIEHINTYTSGAYKIEINKEITIVYSNLDASQRQMTNHVKGTVDLYETEQTNTIEDTHSSVVEIPGTVTVKYIDRETGEEITYLEEQEGEEPIEKTYGYEIEGLAGDTYTTEQIIIPGYTFIQSTGNTSGNIVEGATEVVYYYERTEAGGVYVTYIDEEGNKIENDETFTGKVGDRYETEQKDIYGYDLVRVEGEPEGEMTEGPIHVTYVYKRVPGRVIVRYLEKDETPEDDSDNRVLYPEEIIEGYLGNRYTTNRRDIENYRAAEPEPENKEGLMTREDIYVTYYYEKIPSGKLIVQYVDIDTMEEILYKDEETGEFKTYREESQAYVGDRYETEQKDIPYYKIVEEVIPANREGKYTKEDIYVTYYYEKLEFNIEVDKNVVEILINGKEQKVLDGKLNKVEVVGSTINSTEVKITYIIEIKNIGELDGTAKVEEDIPEDFKLNDETGDEWKETEDGILEAEVELKAGETKELKVVLDWIQGNYRFGVQKNTVRLTETTNEANYEEADTEDNESSAEVVMGVKTGSEISQIIFMVSTLGLIIALLVLVYITDKYIEEKKKNNMTK